MAFRPKRRWRRSWSEQSKPKPHRAIWAWANPASAAGLNGFTCSGASATAILGSMNFIDGLPSFGHRSEKDGMASGSLVFLQG